VVGHWPWPTFFESCTETGSFSPSVGESLIGVLCAVTFYFVVCLGVKHCSILLMEEHNVAAYFDLRRRKWRRLGNSIWKEPTVFCVGKCRAEQAGDCLDEGGRSNRRP